MQLSWGNEKLRCFYSTTVLGVGIKIYWCLFFEGFRSIWLKIAPPLFNFFLLFLFFLSLFPISWAALVAYGGSQARGPVGAVAASLRQSHSNWGSELRLQPTPQFRATPAP